MRFRYSSVCLCTIGLALTSAAGAADVSMVNLVGADAQVITGIDFERSRNSPFGQFFLGQMGGREEGLQKFVEMTGFDPRRDLQEILVAATDAGKIRSGSGGLFIVRGQFNPARIMQLATMHGGADAVSSYNGTQVFQTERGQDAMWAGFLGNLLVAGPKANVQGAIDRYRAARKADTGLSARIQSASSRHDAWMITTMSPAALAGNVNNPNMQGAMKGDLMQGIESLTAGVKFGANVVISGEAMARSDQDATALVDVLKFFASMAQSNGMKSGYASMLDAVQMNAEGRAVRFSLTTPAQEFEKLFAPQVNRVRSRARGSAKLD